MKDERNIEISMFLNSYLDFFDNYYQTFVDFFDGNFENNSFPNEAYSLLLELIDMFDIIDNKIKNQIDNFTTTLDWEIIEHLDTLYQELIFIQNLNKFTRSSFDFPNSFNNFATNYTLNSETIENAILQQFDSIDPQNDWAQVALNNDLLEQDYSYEGGNVIQLQVDFNTDSTPVDSIIDVMLGDSVFGKDIQRVLEFKDDDLVSLNGEDTVYQSVVILAELIKGDIPEFPEIGRTGIIGNNFQVFAAGSLVRQMVETFSIDDTLINFKIKNIDFSDATSPFIEFSVSTRLNIEINQTLSLNSI